MWKNVLMATVLGDTDWLKVHGVHSEPTEAPLTILLPSVGAPGFH